MSPAAGKEGPFGAEAERMARTIQRARPGIHRARCLRRCGLRRCLPAVHATEAHRVSRARARLAQPKCPRYRLPIWAKAVGCCCCASDQAEHTQQRSNHDDQTDDVNDAVHDHAPWVDEKPIVGSRRYLACAPWRRMAVGQRRIHSRWQRLRNGGLKPPADPASGTTTPQSL